MRWSSRGQGSGRGRSGSAGAPVGAAFREHAYLADGCPWDAPREFGGKGSGRGGRGEQDRGDRPIPMASPAPRGGATPCGSLLVAAHSSRGRRSGLRGRGSAGWSTWIPLSGPGRRSPGPEPSRRQRYTMGLRISCCCVDRVVGAEPYMRCPMDRRLRRSAPGRWTTAQATGKGGGLLRKSPGSRAKNCFGFMTASVCRSRIQSAGQARYATASSDGPIRGREPKARGGWKSPWAKAPARGAPSRLQGLRPPTPLPFAGRRPAQRAHRRPPPLSRLPDGAPAPYAS